MTSRLRYQMKQKRLVISLTSYRQKVDDDQDGKDPLAMRMIRSRRTKQFCVSRDRRRLPFRVDAYLRGASSPPSHLNASGQVNTSSRISQRYSSTEN
ncbi:hypothetical protein Trydic_g16794 [Trypoxylus dichotomus]